MSGSTTLFILLAAIGVGVLALWAYRRSSAAPKSVAAAELHVKKVAHLGGKDAAQKPGKQGAAQPANADPKAPPRNQAKQWGVRIATPAKERACQEVRAILGKEFPLDQKPPLPVLNCPFPQQCECTYVKLFDRRKGERRSGQERRQAQRFEKDNLPRRSGKDRRKGRDVDWTS